MQQRVTCTICGFANAPGQKFCGSCGSPLSSACPNCGANLNPGDKFCGNCGAQLPAAPPQTGWRSQQPQYTPPPPQQYVPPQQPQQTQYVPPQQQYVPPPPQYTPPPPQFTGAQREYGQTSHAAATQQPYEQQPAAYGTSWEATPRRSMLPLIILLVFLIVALGGFAWWAFMGNQSWSGSGGLQVTNGPFIQASSDNVSSTRDVTITFETSTQSVGKVEYGTDENYGSATAWETVFTKSHNIKISALTRDTRFHYRVVIKDKNNEEVETTDYTFKTPQ